ncbi:MAG: hypothetical protein MJZ74_08800 [Muribaculaceae bacterium]|nr:hypothetical protein [Muribaculaceae bacterium]
MEKNQWIYKLKELESGFVWDGNNATRVMTEEEMRLAETYIDKETHGTFSYQPNRGYPGRILQCKMISWKELYQILIELPFWRCNQILIPWDPTLLEKFHIKSERIDSFISAGVIPVMPYIREDQYISVYLYVDSRFEAYDKDGYGGGIDDEFAFAVIDKEGRLAYPFTKCIDFDLTSMLKIDSTEFIPEYKRKKIF